MLYISRPSRLGPSGHRELASVDLWQVLPEAVERKELPQHGGRTLQALQVQRDDNI